jgi:hypothetical protein
MKITVEEELGFLVLLLLFIYNILLIEVEIVDQE